MLTEASWIGLPIDCYTLYITIYDERSVCQKQWIQISIIKITVHANIIKNLKKE